MEVKKEFRNTETLKLENVIKISPLVYATQITDRHTKTTFIVLG